VTALKENKEAVGRVREYYSSNDDFRDTVFEIFRCISEFVFIYPKISCKTSNDILRFFRSPQSLCGKHWHGIYKTIDYDIMSKCFVFCTDHIRVCVCVCVCAYDCMGYALLH